MLGGDSTSHSKAPDADPRPQSALEGVPTRLSRRNVFRLWRRLLPGDFEGARARRFQHQHSKLLSMKDVAVTGGFDNIGSRHLRFLQEASSLGPLTVLLWSDEALVLQTGK